MFLTILGINREALSQAAGYQKYPILTFHNYLYQQGMLLNRTCWKNVSAM
jgi:hypothetical protein